MWCIKLPQAGLNIWTWHKDRIYVDTSQPQKHFFKIEIIHQTSFFDSSNLQKILFFFLFHLFKVISELKNKLKQQITPQIKMLQLDDLTAFEVKLKWAW